jgi:hypothetical protein
MKMNTITWTTGSGSVIEVSIAEYLDRAIVRARIDGKIDLASSPTALKSPVSVGGKTIVAAIGKIGLTRERLDQVRAMMAALQAEIDARPDVRMRRLIAKREHLVAEINYILDTAHEDHVRYIEGASANGIAKRGPRDFAAEEKAAREALAEFDRAHPDVVAKIASDRAEANARFLSSC